MSKKIERSPTLCAPGNPPATALLTRRRLLVGGAAFAGSLWLGPAAARAALDASVLQALDKSRLVYVSPLDRDGDESTCHGEVWFFVDQGDVVLVTASDRWKARALAFGRYHARIWVGDFGRYEKDETPLASAPRFDARAEIDKDPEVFARLLEAYAKRYPEEWGKWRPRFIKGYADGTRVAIRYTAV